MDVISGKIRADSGKVMFDASHPDEGMGHPTNIEVHGHIRFEGHELTKMREDQIVRAGIGRKFQTPSVFGSLSCYENVEVASGFRQGLIRFLMPTGQERKERVMYALERVGLVERKDVVGSALSHGERQWLEIAMLLVQDPKLLLLDEPVAGMTGKERERTGGLLHALEGSHSLIVTEHDMDFVRQFSRTVTVLHQGRVLREGTVDAIQQDPEVQAVYIGRQKTPVGVA
jgi:urea transport system ATP-binding protein